jgi:cyanate permease
LSILYAVMGAGSFLVVWLIGAVIESRGNWRSGWWVFVGAGIFGLLLSAAFVRDAPTGEDTGSSELQPLEVHHAVTSNGSELNILQVLRSPLLWAIAFSMLTVMAGSVFMIAHAQVHLRGLGISARAAASTMSILSGAMVVGNLGFGALAPLIELRRAQMLAIAIFCVGLVLLANVQGSATLYSYALIAGIGFGGAQVGSMAMLGHYWGTRVFPALVATGLLVQTAGGGIVPVAAGAYFDTHHSYLPVIYTIVALNVLAVLVLLLTAVPQRQRDAVDESVLLS